MLPRNNTLPVALLLLFSPLLHVFALLLSVAVVFYTLSSLVQGRVALTALSTFGFIKNAKTFLEKQTEFIKLFVKSSYFCFKLFSCSIWNKINSSKRTSSKVGTLKFFCGAPAALTGSLTLARRRTPRTRASLSRLSLR